MGYEAISRNKKVAVFSSRKLKTNSNKKELFGWPNKFKRKGFFYTDSINENEIFRVMKNVTFCKNLVWKKKISFANNIIAIDKNNKKLFDILKKISK